MKKLLIAMFVGLLAISVMATSVVFAQTAQPTLTPQTAQVTQTPGVPSRGGPRGKHADARCAPIFSKPSLKNLVSLMRSFKKN